MNCGIIAPNEIFSHGKITSTPKSNGKVHAYDRTPDAPKECRSKPAQKRRGATSLLESVNVGDTAPDFELEDMMGVKHKLSSYKGRKVLLSFFRFAACHTCLYNIDMMKKQYEMLKDAGILIICIFNSTPQNIARFASASLGESLLALSDKKATVYHTYKVNESSKKTAIRSSASSFMQWKKYKNYMKVGFVRDISMNGMRLLPADFLIDEDGIIVDAFRCESAGHMHMSFERLEAFIPEAKRCKCNKMDCISPKCRFNSEYHISEDIKMPKGENENFRHTIAFPLNCKEQSSREEMMDKSQKNAISHTSI